MFDHEYTISLYFNGSEALTQGDIDQLSDWIAESEENAAKFVQASFMHRGIYDSLTGEVAQKNALFDLMETSKSDSGVLIDSNVSLRGVDLQEFIADVDADDADDFDMTDEMLEILELVRISPAVEIPKEEPKRELIQKVVHQPREKRKVTKFQKFQLGACAAAVILFALFIKFATVKESVAVLAKTMNADWASREFVPELWGSFYSTDKPVFLKSGVIEIEFDYGARVVLEGPCEFSCKSGALLKVEHGRVFAVVPHYATGFTVETPISRVVDLGTEFGVEVDTDGTSTAHVIKGKTRLVSNLMNGNPISEIIEREQAMKVDRHNGHIREATYDELDFVRSFDPETNSLWRGEKINLADIVGGGNGSGSGKINNRIELTDGKPIQESGNAFHGQGFLATPVYPLIDGVFVPDGGEKAPKISSTGLVFNGCPDTSNLFTAVVSNGIEANFDLSIKGVEYCTYQNPAIMMHSNAGVTFDLDAIRRRYPGLDIHKLSCQIGLVDTVLLLGEGKADFFVLLDGVATYKKIAVKTGDLIDAEIDLDLDSRFLTLMVTDGGENEDKSQMIHNDWSLFANPYLHLKPK